MPEKLYKIGLQREPGWFYYVKDCSVMRVRMKNNPAPGGRKQKPELIFRAEFDREAGYLHYIDKQGDISRSPTMNRPCFELAQPIDPFCIAATSPKPRAKPAPILETTLTVGANMELVQKRSKNGNFTSKIKGTTMLHCEDGPAQIQGKETIYELFGMRHRIGGPAEEDQYQEIWNFMGMEHRIGGPFMIDKDGGHDGVGHNYAIFGNWLSKQQYEKLMANKPYVERILAVEKAMDAALRGMKVPEVTEVAGKKAAEKHVTDSIFPMFAVLGLGAGATMLAGNHIKKRMDIAKKAKEVGQRLEVS